MRIVLLSCGLTKYCIETEKVISKHHYSIGSRGSGTCPNHFRLFFVRVSYGYIDVE